MVRQKLNNMVSSGGRDTLLSLASDDFIIEGGLGLQDPTLFEKENEAFLKEAVLDGYMSVLEDSASQGAIDNRPKVSGGGKGAVRIRPRAVRLSRELQRGRTRGKVQTTQERARQKPVQGKGCEKAYRRGRGRLKSPLQGVGS